MTAPVRVGSFDGTPSSATSGAQTLGLQLESTYLWGLHRTQSASADIYSTLRRISNGPAWPSRLLMQSNRGATAIRRIDPERPAARSADIVVDDAPANKRYNAPGSAASESFELTIIDGTLRWSEGSLLELVGQEVTPGLQWCLTSRGDEAGMRYASRIFRVVGVVDGIAVDGFVGCDEVHLAPGRQNYVDDPLTATHLSDAWCTWAAAYHDGSIEAGHAASGRDGFGFGLRSTNGVATTTTDVTSQVVRDERGCPTHIAFDIDGESWEFVADARGLPHEPLPGPVRQAEGWFRRVGETRRPIVWCATPEVPAP